MQSLFCCPMVVSLLFPSQTIRDSSFYCTCLVLLIETSAAALVLLGVEVEKIYLKTFELVSVLTNIFFC